MPTPLKHFNDSGAFDKQQCVHFLKTHMMQSMHPVSYLFLREEGSFAPKPPLELHPGPRLTIFISLGELTPHLPAVVLPWIQLSYYSFHVVFRPSLSLHRGLDLEYRVWGT